MQSDFGDMKAHIFCVQKSMYCKCKKIEKLTSLHFYFISNTQLFLEFFQICLLAKKKKSCTHEFQSCTASFRKRVVLILQLKTKEKSGRFCIKEVMTTAIRPKSEQRGIGVSTSPVGRCSRMDYISAPWTVAPSFSLGQTLLLRDAGRSIIGLWNFSPLDTFCSWCDTSVALTCSS